LAYAEDRGTTAVMLPVSDPSKSEAAFELPSSRRRAESGEPRMPKTFISLNGDPACRSD
jgi:hypothetical protein